MVVDGVWRGKEGAGGREGAGQPEGKDLQTNRGLFWGTHPSNQRGRRCLVSALEALEAGFFLGNT